MEYDPFEEAVPEPSAVARGFDQTSRGKRARSPEPSAVARGFDQTSRGKRARSPSPAGTAVPRQPFLKRRVLCSHFINNDCRWGSDCRFSHDIDELRAGAPATTEMDFSNLESGIVTRAFKIPRRQVELMTESTRLLLARAAGDCDVTWDPGLNRAVIAGTIQQVEKAGQLLKRLSTHCNWGISQAKVEGLLCPNECTTARIRFSPMTVSLKQASATLSATNSEFNIGAGSSNDLVIKGPLVSRNHALIEFTPEKGAVYVADLSTNGTFLNGVKLPSKSGGKVFLSHGDELLFPEENKDEMSREFGYMVNLELI